MQGVLINGRTSLRNLTDIKKEQGSIAASLNPEVRCSDEPVTTNLLSLFARAKEHRNKGIGTEMLNQMLDLLRKEGYKSVSLSVQKANYAMRMYQKAGFKIISEDAEEAIMKCLL